MSTDEELYGCFEQKDMISIVESGHCQAKGMDTTLFEFVSCRKKVEDLSNDEADSTATMNARAFERIRHGGSNDFELSYFKADSCESLSPCLIVGSSVCVISESPSAFDVQFLVTLGDEEPVLFSREITITDSERSGLMCMQPQNRCIDN